LTDFHGFIYYPCNPCSITILLLTDDTWRILVLDEFTVNLELNVIDMKNGHRGYLTEIRAIFRGIPEFTNAGQRPYFPIISPCARMCPDMAASSWNSVAPLFRSSVISRAYTLKKYLCALPGGGQGPL